MGYDPNEPRIPKGQPGGGRWTDGDATTAIQRAASDKFTVGYAPFREGDIADITNTSEAFANEAFKSWRDQGTEIAEAMGIKIEDDNNSVGVYAATSNNAEASRVIEITADPEVAEQYAAIMGAVAPDTQHSVMVNRYDPNGSEKENYITFKSKADAVDFVKNRRNYGIEDVSFFPDKSQVLILDFGNFDLNKTISSYGNRIKELEERKVSTRFIGESEYPAIIRKARDQVQRDNGKASGQKLDNILKQAEKRLSHA